MSKDSYEYSAMSREQAFASLLIAHCSSFPYV